MNSEDRYFRKQEERLFDSMPPELREKIRDNALLRMCFHDASAQLMPYEQFIDLLAVELLKRTEALEKMVLDCAHTIHRG